MIETEQRLIETYPRPIRFRAVYGWQQFYDQKPYFSLTGNGDGIGGCCHDLIVKHFPELRPLVPWHLVGNDALPMHYFANGRHWWDARQLEYFKSTIVFGQSPDDAEWLELVKTGGCPLEEWLTCRLPHLRDAMNKVMAEFKLL